MQAESGVKRGFMPTAKATGRIIPIRDFSACACCTVRQLCLPHGLDEAEMFALDELVDQRPHFRKDEYLFYQGDGFNSLYAIKSGAIKSFGVTCSGKEQITGFHFAGELIGMDAICNNIHNCSAVALEKTVVCKIPYASIESLIADVPSMHSVFARLMSKELRRDDEMLMILGNMSAEQRVACFLYNIYRRLKSRGAVKNELRLPMRREDIGNYLGLSLETVSRRLTGLQHAGIIQVQNRRIELLDIDRLHSLCI